MIKSYRKFKHISTFERARIELLWNHGKSIGQIALELGRSKSAIHYELHRYKDIRRYRAELAQSKADIAKQNSKKPKKLLSMELMHSIERMLKLRWSPEIIAHMLGGAISHTTIYTLTKTNRLEWRKYLTYQKRAKYHKGTASKALIPYRTEVSLRPAEVQFGDFEADTVISSRCGKSCLAVFVERVSRLYKITRLLDKSAAEMTNATLKALKGMRVNSITYDNGTENADHWVTNKLLGCASYFCRPYRSTDKPQIEERNKRLRVWLPKKTNFDLIDESELAIIESRINNRPMKCLNWLTPAEAFHSLSFNLDL